MPDCLRAYPQIIRTQLACIFCAMLPGGEFHGEELDMETKRGLYAEEKDRTARYAAGLVGDGDVVFLDAGTTVLRVAEHLRPSKALFLTNSIECACRLMERNLRTCVLGETLEKVVLRNFDRFEEPKRKNDGRTHWDERGIVRFI